MQFLFPSFLWALLLLAIPIIIHLFYFRRFKKVYFTNVKFLKEVKQETSNRSRLKNLLVLLSRLLALAALIFAFAQPILTDKTELSRVNKAVSIFIDNSFSMQALSQEVKLFDLAKDKARDIVKAYAQADKFQIITHDFEGRHQRLYSQENALSLIDELDISPSVNLLSVVLDRQKQILEQEDAEKEIYLISDFQSNITNFDTNTDTLLTHHLIPLQSVQEKNVSIDSVWFAAPVPMINQPNPMLIKLINYSDEDVENIQLSLEHQGQTRPLGTKRIPPNATLIDTINFSILNTGWHEAEIVISDYPIQFDDRYKISFEVNEKVNILSINESAENKYLTAAFKGLAYFNIKNQRTGNINYAEFKSQDLIILNELSNMSSGLSSSIREYVAQGGNVLIFPSRNIAKEGYNQMLSGLGANTFINSETGAKQVGYINTDEFIFKNVYKKNQRNMKYPSSTFNYSLSNFQRNRAEDLIRYRDGSSYLSKYQHGEGNVYLSAAPLNENANDLVKNAEVFVPMLYKMGISKGKKDNIGYTIGTDNLIETENVIRDDEVVYEIKGPSDFIPGQYNVGSKFMLEVKDQIKEAGFYNVTLDDENLATLAFNFNRLESDLKYIDINELSDKFGNSMNIISSSESDNLTEFIETEEGGTPLWKWCIISVLVFLAIESLLLRLWKS